MYYNSVDYLPMKRLYRIFETGDLTLLVKDEGEIDRANSKTLGEIWENIKKQYKKLDPSSKMDMILEVTQQIDLFKAKHEMISLAVYILRFGEDQEMIDVLKENRYEVDPNNLQESLDSIEERAKSLTTKVGVKENQLKKLTEKSEESKVDLNEILAMMSANLSVTFKFNEVTVVEFFAYKKELERKAKAAKEAQAKRKNGRRR